MNLTMGFMILYCEWIDLGYIIEPIFSPTFWAENRDARIAKI